MSTVDTRLSRVDRRLSFGQMGVHANITSTDYGSIVQNETVVMTGDSLSFELPAVGELQNPLLVQFFQLLLVSGVFVFPLMLRQEGRNLVASGL